MIKPISKVNFMAAPSGPKLPAPLDMSSPAQLRPLQGDVFQPSSVRNAYDGAVTHARNVAKTTTDAVLAAQQGDENAKKHLNVVV